MFEEFSTESPWIGFTKDTATYERLVSSAHSSKQQTQPQQQHLQAVVNLSITELSMQGLKIQGLIHLRPSLANLLQATEPAQSYSSTSSPALSTSTPADLHVQVPVFGEHNLTNLMVAASLGVACGMTISQIESALSHCRTNWGRNQLVQTQSGAQILFDGYNANPDSMQALVQNLKLIHNRGQRIGVFAEMLEMGPAAAELHHELGSLVAKENFTKVYFYGAHFEDFAKGVKMVNSKLELIAEKDFSPDRAAQIASGLTKEDIALVKGSRGMKTERFVFACQPIDFKGKEG
jgi:UDP-N-acetylmuramyl pentapeptide synthase